jgi:hypothetical protein
VLLSRQCMRQGFGSQGLDLIWYGDSISEHFLGTDTGDPTEKSTAAAWEKHYGKYRSACFSLAHDGTPGVLWRVINGEAPEARMWTYLPLPHFSDTNARVFVRMHSPCMHSLPRWVCDEVWTHSAMFHSPCAR